MNDIFEQIQNDFNEFMKQAKELVEKHQNANTSKTKRWKPKNNEKYFYITPDFKLNAEYFEGQFDEECWGGGNCFKTKEQAQKELDRRLAEQELLDMCDWKCGLPRYEIDFDVNSDIFLVFGDLGSLISSPYRFSSEESCQQALDTLGTEKLKLIFRID